jgi:hypothetical protein
MQGFSSPPSGLAHFAKASCLSVGGSPYFAKPLSESPLLELRKRTKIDPSFEKTLSQFLTMRNRPAHSAAEIEGRSIETRERPGICLRIFIRSVRPRFIRHKYTSCDGVCAEQ